MPSTETCGQSQEFHRLLKRYHRLERVASTSVAIGVAALFLGAYLATALFPAVAVGAVLVVAVRAPVFRSRGTVRLRTDDDPEAVCERFSGPRPPVLALQWGVADEVTTEEQGTHYIFRYLFGLRSTAITVRTRMAATSSGADRVAITVSVDDTPWGTYVATIHGTEAGSVVDVEYTSDRRFGLWRVPQQVLGEQYRDGLLNAQGFTVVDREVDVGV